MSEKNRTMGYGDANPMVYLLRNQNINRQTRIEAAWKRYPVWRVSPGESVSLEAFRTIDREAVERYHIPIELMMENAGLHLATVAAACLQMGETLLIGCGHGNNGGGGLVAARRLASWGFDVHVHLPESHLRPLPALQLKRALAVGVKNSLPGDPKVIIDAYLGSSQRLPLTTPILKLISHHNRSEAIRISLDLPTGFVPPYDSEFFRADLIVTLGALKNLLFEANQGARIFVADIGIPPELLKKHSPLLQVPFRLSPILACDVIV